MSSSSDLERQYSEQSHSRQKSEDNLNVAESEIEKHQRIVEDLDRKVDELQVHADEAARLKDQVDESAIQLKILTYARG